MGYKKHSFYSDSLISAPKFIADQMDISLDAAKRLIDKRRVLLDGKVLISKGEAKGLFEVATYQPKPLNIEPVFVADDFAIYEKPAGLLVHKNAFSSEPTLLDSIKARFTDEANLAHRLDRETSGLVLVSLNRQADQELKELFACNLIEKKYLAYVRGKPSDQMIDQPILAGSKTLNERQNRPKTMSLISQNGKKSRTMIRLIRYFDQHDYSLVEATPITGRTHQIRLHLAHINHAILGDPLYGVPPSVANDYLDKKLSCEDRHRLTKAPRLMLHANSLKFFYKKEWNFQSREVFDESLFG